MKGTLHDRLGYVSDASRMLLRCFPDAFQMPLRCLSDACQMLLRCCADASQLRCLSSASQVSLAFRFLQMFFNSDTSRFQSKICLGSRAGVIYSTCVLGRALLYTWGVLPLCVLLRQARWCVRVLCPMLVGLQFGIGGSGIPAASCTPPQWVCACGAVLSYS